MLLSDVETLLPETSQLQYRRSRLVAQLGERLAGSQKVIGSSPLSPLSKVFRSNELRGAFCRVKSGKVAVLHGCYVCEQEKNRDGSLLT